MTGDLFGRLVQASAKQHMEDSPQAVIAYARDNIHLETDQRYLPDIVAARTSNVLHTVDKATTRDEFFKHRQERKRENKNCGFFSVNGEPYKPLGDICLNSKILTLQKLLPDWHLEAGQVSIPRRIRKYKDKPENDKSKLTLTNSGQEIHTSLLHHIAKFEAGGIAPIRDSIQESRDRLTAVKGGIPYETVIRLKEEAKAREKALKSEEDARLVMKQLSKINVASSQHGTLLASVSSHHAPEVTARRTAAITEKLSSIYDILCCIHNLRARDLKTRVPLKHDVLKTLCLEPLSTPGDRRTHAGRFRSKILHSIIDAASSSDSPKNGLTPIMSSIRPGSKLVHFGGRRRHGPGLFVLGGESPEPRVETWDDLFHISDTICKERKRSHWESAQENLRKKLFIDTQDPGSKKNTVIAQAVAHKRAPLWQTIQIQERACFNTTASSPKSVESAISNISEGKSDGLVDDMKIKLDHIKYQKNNDVVRYLNAMESERKRHSSLKFTAFTLLEPLYERQKAKMDRLNATMIGPVVDKEEEKEPCSWYTQIEKGCSKLPANEDLDSNLKKLSKFSKEDIRHSIPHAKDYVCLLLMSYPAVRLVNVAVQQAFQFVITEILGGMLELYQFWMQQRRIPVVQVVASPASRPPSIQLRKTSTRGRRPTSTCLN